MATRYATAAEVIEIAPEFTGHEATINIWLGVAENWIDTQVWGTPASDAHRLLTAHMLTVAAIDAGGQGIGSGPLSGESNGPASRSFATPQPSDAELGLSTYGRLYISLRKRIHPRTSALLMRSGSRFLRGIKT